MKPKDEAPKEIPSVEKLYTPKEVAVPLRVNERVILDLLRKGKLGGVKVGKAWRIRESDLKAFMEQSGQAQGAAPRTPGKR
jgi:excisionase family DNA binding protein